MNVETPSRLQFAFIAAFHYLYPPLSIGLGVCSGHQHSPH